MIGTDSLQFTKGYSEDAAVDIIMDADGKILPGFHRIKLPVGYEPQEGEVAIVSPRTSTLNAGIFTSIGLIDPGYKGTISAWVFNTSGKTYHYKKGDRLFSVVNLQLAPTRVSHKIEQKGKRGNNKLGSSGGHTSDTPTTKTPHMLPSDPSILLDIVMYGTEHQRAIGEVDQAYEELKRYFKEVNGDGRY